MYHVNVTVYNKTKTTDANPGKYRYQNSDNVLNQKLTSIIYYCAFCLYTACSVIQNTTFEEIAKTPTDTFVSVAEVMVIVLLMVKIVSEKHDPRNWIITVLGLTIGFISWRMSGTGVIFWAMLFILASKGVNLKKIATITIWVCGTLILVTLSSSYLGQIQNIMIINSTRERAALGFDHPNTLGLYLEVICLSCSVIRFGNKPTLDTVALLLVSIFNILVIQSRTALLAAVMQAILIWCIYLIRNPRQKMVLCETIIITLIIVVFFSIMKMVTYSDYVPMDRTLDHMLSGRLFLDNYFYKHFPIGVFGNDFQSVVPFEWWGGTASGFLVDNAYCYLILHLGIIPTLIYTVIFVYGIIRTLRIRAIDEVGLGFFLMAFYGVCEALTLHVEYNYFLIAISSELLYKKFD